MVETKLTGAIVKDVLVWFGVIAAVLNLAFTGGVLYQRIVFLEVSSAKLETADAKLDTRLTENDSKFTQILVQLGEIKTTLSMGPHQRGH